MTIKNQPTPKATTWRRKMWPEYFSLISSGKKKFDLRVNDFEAKEGDILVLEEWDPKTKEYTGRKIEKKINFVLKFKLDSFGQEEEIKEKGIIIMQME